MCIRDSITGSLHNKEIAARISKERTEYRQETIENILDLADQKKVEAIAEGKSVCLLYTSCVCIRATHQS